jgi:hypothetical protein
MDEYGDEIYAIRKPWRGRLWRRRRKPLLPPPRNDIHILGGERVVDMAPVLPHTDASQFIDMLAQVLRHGGRGPYPSDWWVDWDLINYEPELAEAITFVEERKALAEAPVHYWREDQLMPRLCA